MYTSRVPPALAGAARLRFCICGSAVTRRHGRGKRDEAGSGRTLPQRGVRRLRQHLPVAEAQERGGGQALRQGGRALAARDRERQAHHPHQRAVRRRAAPHRHEPLLRQPGAAPQSARQLDRHELVPVRAPPFPALGLRGDRLPAAHRAAQELRRYPHGHGYPRPLAARHLLRRVHHPLRRRRLHAGADPAQGTRAPHRGVRQRLHGRALHRHLRRRDPRGGADRADPRRRAARGRPE